MFKGSVKEKWANLKHSSRFFGLVLALLGAIRLMTVLGEPRVEALHRVDVLGLVTSGAVLGIGFVGLKVFTSSFKSAFGDVTARYCWFVKHIANPLGRVGQYPSVRALRALLGSLNSSEYC